MMRALANLRDRFFGRGAYAITVPPMDGVLRPNEWLDAAAVLTELPAPNHLHAAGDALWLSSGSAIYCVERGISRIVQSCATDITAFARTADGRQGFATRAGDLTLPCPVRQLPEGALRQSITGLAFDDTGGCFLTVGSMQNPADLWQKDLLERHASGSLWYISAAGDARMVVDGLAWPQSPLAEPDGSVLVSESNASRVLRIASSGQRDIAITNLPGYPAGLAHTAKGYVLCIKAPRSQLVEFILREPEFCAQMIHNMPSQYWIAPALYPPQSVLEPLQAGAVKQLGMVKPWAPTRSYGLVVELDRCFVPLRSHHSRANGSRHGTVSCGVVDGQLAVASVGAGCVLMLPLGGEAQS